MWFMISGTGFIIVYMMCGIWHIRRARRSRPPSASAPPGTPATHRTSRRLLEQIGFSMGPYRRNIEGVLRKGGQNPKKVFLISREALANDTQVVLGHLARPRRPAHLLDLFSSYIWFIISGIWFTIIYKVHMWIFVVAHGLW